MYTYMYIHIYLTAYLLVAYLREFMLTRVLTESTRIKPDQGLVCQL